MKQGRYFTIPESPSDVDRLREAARPLDHSDLPDWLDPADARSYLRLGCSDHSSLPEIDSGRYFSEIEELEIAGIIVDHDPDRPGTKNLYISSEPEYEEWSIGIYTGETPFDLAPAEQAANPVLSRSDVDDVAAVFVADPFMINSANRWYMFFEVLNWRENKGEIGLATSDDGYRWSYQQIVLSEPFHLSYPHVFWDADRFYMIPESHQDGSVRLYRSNHFPTQWEFAGPLLEGGYFVDASIFRHQDRWWLFADESPRMNHDTLGLFYAEELTGPWKEHKKSPVVRENPHMARPAGRVTITDNRIIRYAQNCHPAYGTEVRAFEVTDLSLDTYQEREIGPSPVLGPGNAGWNASGMHHVDAHQIGNESWLACVDGRSRPRMSR